MCVCECKYVELLSYKAVIELRDNTDDKLISFVVDTNKA
jgi:hypothetical protein